MWQRRGQGQTTESPLHDENTLEALLGIKMTISEADTQPGVTVPARSLPPPSVYPPRLTGPEASPLLGCSVASDLLCAVHPESPCGFRCPLLMTLGPGLVSAPPGRSALVPGHQPLCTLCRGRQLIPVHIPPWTPYKPRYHLLVSETPLSQLLPLSLQLCPAQMVQPVDDPFAFFVRTVTKFC